MYSFAAFFLLLVIPQACDGFYVPGSNKHIFTKGEHLYVKVNSLTSIATLLPFSYYTLPYCKPPWRIKKSRQNLGQILMKDEILSSAYRLRMNVNETLYLCTTPPLSEHDVRLLRKRTKDLYQVNMILDGLPFMRYYSRRNGIRIKATGFPVGYTVGSNDDYIINHLKLRVLIQENGVFGYEIVGVEVVPCSIRYDPGKTTKLHMYDPVPEQNCPLELHKSQVIRENERVSFTYGIEFLESDNRRLDAYLLNMEGTQLHWSSILNSLIVVCIFAFGILRILRNTRRRDDEVSKEEIPGWRLVIGDVLREPGQFKLLCVMVGNGVQITGAAILTAVLAALGFLSPVSSGMLVLGLIVCYLLLGIVSGYVSVRLWITIKGNSESEEWKSLSWSVSSFFPGIVFLILASLDSIYQANHSTGAIPMHTYLQLFALWFCISVPLTLSGGYLGTRGETIPAPQPVHTNHIPRPIDTPGFRSWNSWLLVLVAGFVTFSTILVELFFVLSSIWLGRTYQAFGFLLIVLILLIAVCAHVSVVITYKRLRAEDWKWWWKAFLAPGCAGLYVFSYCAKFLICNLNGLSGSAASALLYLGYSLIISIAVVLSTGAIGFLTSFYFVWCLYSSLNIEAMI